MSQKRATYLSAAAYTGVSLAGAAAFLLVTTFAGNYTWVSRVGGSGWVFLLSMIILMPTLAPWLRKRLVGADGKSGGEGR